MEGSRPHLGGGQSEIMNKFAIIKEFLVFLRERKKWWLAPIVVFLLLLGALLVFAKGSALAPFIYSLF
jgi:hypothetical protein